MSVTRESLFGTHAEVLVETVAYALHMEAEGKIETTEQDDAQDFAENCVDIAYKAVQGERMTHEEGSGDFDWDEVYTIMECELLALWGKEKNNG